jgi:uncharacterized integral membrane protein (TIGR00697 family)
MLALLQISIYTVIEYSIVLAILWLLRDRIDAALAAVFFGALTTSQFLANKLVDSGVGVAPAGTDMFLISVAAVDAIAVFFGRAYALKVVRAGFLFQTIVALSSWFTATLQPPEWFAERAAVVDSVIAPSARIAIASLTAYVVSYTVDVYIVTKWPRLHLLTRVYSSTLISQVIDTVTFITIAFGFDAEAVLGTLFVKWALVPFEAVLIYGARRYIRSIQNRGTKRFVQ